MYHYERFMQRCLQIAVGGRGFVAPNPLVGAVIVQNDIVIGEGFHRKYGEAHAEVNAINSVKDASVLKRATLFVNLEPCSHYGKTPPCADLIIQTGIPRVVIGQLDPYPEVAGKGIEMLRKAGVEVISGVLEAECEELNREYLTYIKKKRPYIILKWAESGDGFLDRYRTEGDGQKPFRLSSDFTKMLVHKSRSETAAIMVGKRTWILDKPKLDVRYWHGNNPRKIVADSTFPLEETLEKLYNEKIQSLMVEGGALLLNSFLEKNLWDEIHIETTSHILNSGVASPKPKGLLKNVQKCEKSFIFDYINPLNS